MLRDSVTIKHAATRLANGLRLHYTRAGDAAGIPLIMLHGYSDSAFSFSELLPLLAPSATLYALDQRGHGDSDRPADNYTMPVFAADVIGFMDAMQLSQAILVGHSMGSFVALETALRAPNRVAGLALLGSAADPRRLNGAAELQQAVDELRDPVPPDFVEEFQTSTAFQPLDDAFLAQVIQESLKLPARVWQAALRGLLSADYRERLALISAPTLLLWGEQDSIFFRSEQAALLAGITGSRLQIYPDTGHAIHWERPEQVAQELRDFIK
ncbi:MAG: alpha/beta fold hydrolase [Oscillochloris sp.]|nr:alpha/beta fold hydrolase [Oscillochloris sp.]